MTAVAALLLAILSVPYTAVAQEAVDTTQLCSVTVDGGNPEAVFYLYRVAETSETGGFRLCEAFSSYSLDLNALDSEGWRDMALTLRTYISRDSIAAYAEQEADGEGQLTFEKIPTGLYLLVGDSGAGDSGAGTFVPSLISLPELETADTWNYHPVVKPKTEAFQMTQCTALKVWKEETDQNKRPAQIVVQLLKTGEGVTQVYDEQVLSAENNWQYTWKQLDDACQWSVAEKAVPDGYGVRISQNGTCFTITNTYQTSETSPIAPSASGKLPYTGLLWWPVSLLAAAGLLFLLVGAWLRKKSGE